MKCPKCKTNDVTTAYEICGACKGAKAVVQQQQLVERSKKGKDKTSVPGWLMTTEHEFATIDKGTLSYFNKNNPPLRAMSSAPSRPTRTTRRRASSMSSTRSRTTEAR